MRENILRESTVTKIFINYITEKGLKKKDLVTLRFMDSRECYFSAAVPANIQKPKRRSQAELVVYTADGIYKATVNVNDANLSVNEIIYQTTVPAKWDFVQLRSSSRKHIMLNGTLKFNDGYEIKFDTYDLAIGGLAFLSKDRIPSIYQRFTCILTLEFPSHLIMNFPDRKLITEAKITREKENVDGEINKILYGVKFIKLTNEESLILKNYLLSVEDRY